MLNKKILLWLLGLLFLAQLAVPAYMIANREMTLAGGKQFKFKAAPVDPYDPFRGRYVSLNFDTGEIPATDNGDYLYGDTVFAVMETDENGYARFTAVSKEKPAAGDYMEVRVANTTGDANKKMIRVRLPFDRYYMDEELAPEAEKEYSERLRENTAEIYVTVRVVSGAAVLERLYIDGTPIEEYLAKK